MRARRGRRPARGSWFGKKTCMRGVVLAIDPACRPASAGLPMPRRSCAATPERGLRPLAGARSAPAFALGASAFAKTTADKSTRQPSLASLRWCWAGLPSRSLRSKQGWRKPAAARPSPPFGLRRGSLRLLRHESLRWLAEPELAKQAKAGGRDRDRTCDPYHVKVVLSR